MVKLIKKTIFLSIGLFGLFSCNPQKKEDPQPIGSNNTTPDPVDVRNDNSGFTQFYDKTINTQGIAGSNAGGVLVYDFSLESNNNFNFAYSWSSSYQQGQNTYFDRYSFKIDTKEEVPLPQYASPINKLYIDKSAGQYLAMMAYRPYTNFLVYSLNQRGGSGGAPYEKSDVKGDLSGSIPKNYLGIGTPDMGFQFPMYNPVVYAKDGWIGNVMSGYFSSNYLLTAVTPNMVFRFGSELKGMWHDISSIKKIATVYSFDLTADSLIVNTLSDFQDPNATITATTTTYQTGIPISFSISDITKTVRHYSTDGKVFGFLMGNETTNVFSTFSYNYETNVLTKGLQGVSLDYLTVGSDIELDEFGNVYYTGFANNGTNKNGASIYLKKTDGTNTLVGKDNFLKFGKIEKLKLFYGKLYLAITGQISGTSFQQISFLKQE